MTNNYDQTMQFSIDKPKANKLADILQHVYTALEEKGYDPIDQIIGYIISGDPTYITSHNDARKKIKQVDRNDILETLLEFYLENNNIK